MAVPATYTQKMYMIANLAVGGAGSWPAPPTGATTASYSIDYIRAYSADPTVAAVALQPISSPDGVNTTPSYTTPAIPAAPVIGTEPDVLVLNISEDAYQGDVHFTISIDGVQQGGVMIAQADHSAGQTQAFTIDGAFRGATHIVTVSDLNAVTGTTGFVRNLYVTGTSLNGTAIPAGTLSLATAGAQSFVIPLQPITVIGTGADTLALTVSEDAYLVDARFTVSVNGVQQGGTLVATAANAAPYTPLPAQSQVFDILGSFAGTNVVTVNFLNDLYGGSAASDRNLYVQGATINGTAITGGVLAAKSGGPQSFSFTEPTAPITTTTTGAGATLILNLSEDAYLGDAQFSVTVDGKPLGMAQAVTTLHASSTSQAFDFADARSTGTHDVAVSFLNDLYGGAPALDRNLYIDSASVGGIVASAAPFTLLSTGTHHFAVVIP